MAKFLRLLGLLWIVFGCTCAIYMDLDTEANNEQHQQWTITDNAVYLENGADVEKTMGKYLPPDFWYKRVERATGVWVVVPKDDDDSGKCDNDNACNVTATFRFDAMGQKVDAIHIKYIIGINATIQITGREWPFQIWYGSRFDFFQYTTITLDTFPLSSNQPDLVNNTLQIDVVVEGRGSYVLVDRITVNYQTPRALSSSSSSSSTTTSLMPSSAATSCSKPKKPVANPPVCAAGGEKTAVVGTISAIIIFLAHLMILLMI